MSGFKLDRYQGIVPRLPATLLGATNAAAARNCDFAYGELRSTTGSAAERTLANVAASIYTDDGELFYSWPFDVNAVRSPMAADLFNRLYYSTPDDIRVTSRAGMTTTGGEPATSYRVGVPKPASAPGATAAAGTVDAPTNAGILPAFMGGHGDAHEYHPSDFGPVLGTVHLNLPAAGSVAVIVTWQVIAPTSDHLDTRVQVTVDGSVMLDQIESGFGGFVVPYAASSSIALAAGGHDFSIRFSNDYTDGWYLLGRWGVTVVPVQVAGDALPDAAVVADVTRAYVFTQVNIYGEEGPPSPPVMLTTAPGAVVLSLPWVVPVIDYAPIKELRIYRTADAGGIAEYFYAGTVPVLGVPTSMIGWTDTTAAAELNEALASTYYYPPDPALVGLMSLPNGILMAWKGNELHFSDAYKPWSWPPAYVLTFGDFNLVGAIAVGASVLVTTTGKPYMVSGVSPDSMTNSSINIQQAGASKWALADIGGQIVYASHDGIVAFDGGLPSMAFSDNYFTREVWRARYAAGLASMRFAVWDGRLIVYSAAAAFTPFMIGLDESRGAMTELPDLLAQCSFVSPVADQCFIATGTSLLRFAAGGPLTASWTSRLMVLDRPRNYSVAQAVCNGSWTVQFYADNVLRHTQGGLSSNTTFRLPAGYLADRWQVVITGSGSFLELRVGEAAADLKAL